MTAARTRLAIAAALIAAAVIAVVAVVASGGAGGDASALRWKGKVEVFDSSRPTDKILYAQIENASLEDVELEAKKVKVYDADGREVFSAMRFLAAFAHGIYGEGQKDERGEFERRRLGELTTLKPGKTMPVTLSWRVPEGGKQPVRVDFGPADLPIPARSTPLP